MDFNNLFPILQQNLFNIILLLFFVIFAIKIVQFFLKDTFILDMTKTEWSRDIPKEVMYKDGEAPPDNLTGWVPLFHSSVVKAGQITSAEFCGHDLVVFRASSGKIHVLDAYCPHMGTYLPIGKVVGDDIRCPFHGWTFNGKGQCTHVPGLDEPSLPKAKVKVWLSVEQNDMIYFWYDSNNEEPTWMPHHFDLKESTRFAGTFKMHCDGYFIDVPINGADYTHFTTVHSSPDFIPAKSLFQQTLFARLATKLIHFQYKPMSKRGPEPHQYEFKVGVSLYILGICVLSGIEYRILYDGPYIFYLSLSGWLSKQVSVILFYTPAPGRKINITNYVFTSSNLLSKLIGIIILRFQGFLIYRDAIIFSGKKWIANPHYSKWEEDHAKLNKWFHQFYPKNYEIKETNESIKNKL